MKFSEYLIEKTISDTQMAAVLGVSRVAVNRYKHGTMRPGGDVIKAIVAATGGLVTANDLLGIEQSAPAE